MIIERNSLEGRSMAVRAGYLAVTLTDCVRFSLRVGKEGREEAGSIFGCELARRVGGWASAGSRSALCLGPDEWLLMAPDGESSAIEQAFSGATDLPLSLVDVSHREVDIELRGADATLVLRSACALDLESMAAGTGTRTIFDRAQVILIKHASDHYRIEVWQSFASHVWGLLEAASRECAIDAGSPFLGAAHAEL